jgi:ABC-type Na+ efflux pump permease subunit
VRSTADCLSEEKREGTLGLLFLTNLRGYDIVLGKLAANSLGTLYGVLSIIPALGIPILLGGTSAGQFARVSISILAVLFFSLTAGMLASAVCRSSRKARALAFVIIFFFTGGVPALGAWLSYALKEWDIVKPFLATSPIYSYVAGLDWQFVRMGDAFYWSTGTILFLALMFLAVAAFATPRAWQDRPMGKRSTSSNNGISPAESKNRAFRTRALDANPFFWLSARPRTRIWYVWVGYGCVGLVWLWGMFKFKDEWFNIGIYVATGLFLNSMLKVWVASEACRQIAADRKHGTLELLLATPLSVGEIIEGQRLALQRQFGLPILAALVLETLMLGALMRDSSMSGGDRTMWLWVWLLAMSLLLFDIVAFFWMGLWAGLTARDARRAYTRMISAILVLPWVVFACFLAGLGAGVFGPGHNVSWKPFVGVWFFSGLAADIVFGATSRARLWAEFRQRATERYRGRTAK